MTHAACERGRKVPPALTSALLSSSWRAASSAAALGLVLVASSGCDDDEPTQKATPPTVEVSQAELAVSAQSGSPGGDQPGAPAEVTRARFDGPLPAQASPEDARPVALGIRYRALKVGDGATPAPKDSLLVDLRAWDESGKLVTDTTQQSEPLSLSWGIFPEALRGELSSLRVGTRLQLWLPQSARARLSMPGWPSDGEVRVEMVLVGAAQPTATVQRLTSLRGARAKFPPPSLDGPPEDAKSAEGGVRYWWLSSGPEGSQARAGSQLELLLSVHTVSGMAVTKMIDDQVTRMTMGNAPAGLQPVLDQMVAGDTVRAWLPPERAREVLPQVDSAAVVDVTLVQVL